MKAEFSALLDVTRWMAAGLVVLNHVRHVLLVDYGEVQERGLLVNAVYFISGLGHEAVVLFFVVSGFLVGGITLRKWQAGRRSFAEYFASRFSRIYTVLVPALVFGGLLDYSGYLNFNGAELYTNSAQYRTNSLNLSISTELGIDVFFGNLAMLGNNVVPALGSNGPLWSLFYEWWYYCAYIGLLGLWFCKDMGTRALCAAGIAGIVALMPLHWLVYMSIWLLGIGALVYCESGVKKPNAVVSLAVFLGAMAYSRLSTHEADGPEGMGGAFARDGLIAVGYVMVLASTYGREKMLIPFKGFHRWMAEFSFSLYVAHFPILIFLVAALKDIYDMPFVAQPGFSQWLYFAGLTLVIYAYAFVFSLASERRTPRVRAWLMAKFTRS